VTAIAIAATIARYENVRYSDRQYVRIKLRTDPLTAELLAYDVALGDVVDAGCGRGQFGLLLLELGRVRSLFGYDWDQEKIASATLAASESGRYEVADFRNPPTPQADSILLFDVLQYLSSDEQRTLLRSLAASLRPGGRLLIRATNRGRGWQARFSQWLERIARATGINRSHLLEFRSSADLKADLEALGLSVRQVDRGSSSLLDNRLWIAELSLNS
jgi:SAM-dependent methyltransferase